jgi:hypothetical protein
LLFYYFPHSFFLSCLMCNVKPYQIFLLLK